SAKESEEKNKNRSGIIKRIKQNTPGMIKKAPRRALSLNNYQVARERKPLMIPIPRRAASETPRTANA
ncbi:hypothetical protein, partial [Escherichia coli]|uniref:hypothetical protein n=1 Tax=Escherichia coli TaxID=562 RepID=UPI001BDB9EA3